MADERTSPDVAKLAGRGLAGAELTTQERNRVYASALTQTEGAQPMNTKDQAKAAKIEAAARRESNAGGLVAPAGLPSVSFTEPMAGESLADASRRDGIGDRDRVIGDSDFDGRFGERGRGGVLEDRPSGDFRDRNRTGKPLTPLTAAEIKLRADQVELDESALGEPTPERAAAELELARRNAETALAILAVREEIACRREDRLQSTRVNTALAGEQELRRIKNTERLTDVEKLTNRAPNDDRLTDDLTDLDEL